MKMGGPYWGASIHDQDIVDALLKRAHAMAATLCTQAGDSVNEKQPEGGDEEKGRRRKR